MKIALLGDIALFGKFCVNHNSKIENYFKEVASLLASYDLVVGNLETPFSVAKLTNGAKSAYISSDVENVKILKFLNIGVVNLANNHIFDFGIGDYQLTKKILEQNNIQHFGTEGKQIFVEQTGNKIAFSGYCCYSTNPLQMTRNNSIGVNELNVEVVAKAIAENHKKGYYNIVSIHTGQEHVNYPNYDAIEMALSFAKVANYTFYGHHPHVAQGIHQVEGSLLAYSLGNFCFDDVYINNGKDILVKLSENNKSSFILELNIENSSISSYKTIPIYMADDRMIIGQGATNDKIKKYTQAIKQMNKEEYKTMREKLLDAYINTRKSNRNLSWYIKRLKPRYFKMILAEKNNSKKYQQSVKRYL